MTDIQVTKAIMADSLNIGKIAYQVALIHYQKTKNEFKKPTLKGQTEYIKKSISDKDILVLTAKIHEEVVGYTVVYFNTYPDKYFRFSKRAFIGSFGIEENHRRQGIGKALLTAVEEEVKKRHIKMVEVDYYIFNEAAENLYRSAGYTEKKRFMCKPV